MKRVVVTGMGVISPVGNGVSNFWQGLLSGKNGIGAITKFDTTDYKVKIAAEVKDFNPLDYMEKGESRKQDLFSQYAVAAATEAMADSGITPENTEAQRLGVYVGSGTGGMTTFSSEAQKLFEKGPGRISPFFIPMMIGNMATGNIAIRFGAEGPSLPIVTACATSTNAVGEAYRAIKHGYADAIIAGGSEATIVPLAVAGFTNCMALTQCNDPETASLPFDRRRSGFVMGEGAGILILEEYEHAVNRGAKLYGEVTGYGNTNDAYHMTAPHPEALGGSRAIKQALWESASGETASPQALTWEEDCIYINAHGTGTVLNDKAETAAIKQALGLKKAKQAHISSTKSMTGHMLGAAGVVEAVATVLALRDGKIPPTIGYGEPDPDCDLNYTPCISQAAPVSLGLSISLGFGGHNACLAMRKL